MPRDHSGKGRAQGSAQGALTDREEGHEGPDPERTRCPSCGESNPTTYVTCRGCGELLPRMR